MKGLYPHVHALGSLQDRNYNVLLVESFDYATTIGVQATNLRKWTTLDSVGSVVGYAASRALSGQCRSGQSDSNLITAILNPTTPTQGVCGFAFQITAAPGSTKTMWRVAEGFPISSFTSHLSIQMDSSRRLLVIQGNGTTLATSTNTITTSTWYYVEFKWTIHDSAGAYELRVNGSSTGWCSGSGVDTRNGGSGVWNHCLFTHFVNATKYDDIYILDQNGVNSDFWGDTRIKAALASTDAVSAGSNAQYTLSTGTDHGAVVDEGDPNGDTDYAASSTPGQRESYNFPDTTLNGRVRCVGVNIFNKKTDAGPRTVKSMVRKGGVNYDHANAFTPATTYGYDAQIWETDPSTSAEWTVSGVNASEFGTKVES